LSFASLLGLAAAMAGAFAGKPDGLLGNRLDDHFSDASKMKLDLRAPG
jgi:hypothetical protein